MNGKAPQPTESPLPIEEVIQTKHEELIHSVRYDYYGKKIVTCSSDQKLKVWEQDESGSWRLTADWKAHKGSIFRAEWVHPRFGSVLVSCSFDQSVKIWQETEEEKDGLRTWQKKAEMIDSSDSVVDIKVAPPHEGLRIATCSADGQVRIYDALDTSNLAHWSLSSSFSSYGGKGSTCISWNPSHGEPPMIVEGNSEGIATVWESKPSGAWEIAYQLIGHKGEILDVSWAPNLGRDCNIIATASRDRTARLWRLPGRLSPTKFDAHEMTILPHDSTVWQVEWNVLGTVLATSADDGTAYVWGSDFFGRWKVLCVSYPGRETGVVVNETEFEMRRSASEGHNLAGLKEKKKEKERETDLLFGERDGLVDDFLSISYGKESTAGSEDGPVPGEKLNPKKERRETSQEHDTDKEMVRLKRLEVRRDTGHPPITVGGFTYFFLLAFIILLFILYCLFDLFLLVYYVNIHV